jgi:hypothetical protein
MQLSPLEEYGPNELRLWVARREHPAIAAVVISATSIRRCTLRIHGTDSVKAHCVGDENDVIRDYMMLLRQLEPFSGHRYHCYSDPESDAEIHIEWIDTGKLFAVQSNDPRVGRCQDVPSSLISQVIARAGWQTLPQ